jgi:hypothetical protein
MKYLLVTLCFIGGLKASAQLRNPCSEPSFYFADLNGNEISSMDSLDLWTSIGYSMPNECEIALIIDSMEVSFAGFSGYAKSMSSSLSEKAIRFCKLPVSIKRNGHLMIWYRIEGLGRKASFMRIDFLN